MKRFFLNFSYIGSGFRGLQRQVPRSRKAFNATPTVAEVIELCFQKVLALSDVPTLKTASRTDSGVHALKSAGHIDLDIGSSAIHDVITGINQHFHQISCPVRIINAQRVKDDFDSRHHAVRRSYLYRFAIRKPDAKFIGVFPPAPITEYLRCHFVNNPEFDIDSVQKVLPLFRGVHDFRTFMKSVGSRKNRIDKEIITTREIFEIDVTPGQPFLPSPLDNNFNYWNFTCSAKSFLYKQIRRTVAALLRVGDGTFSYNDIEYMIDNPSSTSWNINCRSAPPYGLYLTDVAYDEEDLIEPVDEHIKSTDLQTSPKDVIGLTINEKINLRLEKLRKQRYEESLREEEKLKNC